MEQHYLTLLGLFVTAAGAAWYDREAQNPVLAAVVVLALLTSWVCWRLGPPREGEDSAEDE
jgi:hypothetical protein